MSISCPKDPNAKSGCEGREEHDRITECRKQKEKADNSKGHNKLTEVLNSFGLFYTESLRTDNSEEKQNMLNQPFSDILVLKNKNFDE